jgi:hypothetical protein
LRSFTGLSDEAVRSESVAVVMPAGSASYKAIASGACKVREAFGGAAFPVRARFEIDQLRGRTSSARRVLPVQEDYERGPQRLHLAKDVPERCYLYSIACIRQLGYHDFPFHLSCSEGSQRSCIVMGTFTTPVVASVQF